MVKFFQIYIISLLAYVLAEEVPDKSIKLEENSIPIQSVQDALDTLQSNAKNITIQDPYYESHIDEIYSYGTTDFNISFGTIPELDPNYLLLKESELNPDQKSALSSLKYYADIEHDMDSAIFLAQIYTYGNFSIPPDPKQALHYYKLVSDTVELPEANFMLGVFYGSGVFGHIERDQPKSLIHYQLAADKGNVHAQMALANRYMYGLGVENNYDLAIYYFSLVAKHSDIWVGESPFEPNIDKFNIRISDLYGGLYGQGSSSSRLGYSLRRFQKFEDYSNFNDDNDRYDMALINKYQVRYFYMQKNYYGDYLTPRDFKASYEYAKICALDGLEEPEVAEYLLDYKTASVFPGYDLEKTPTIIFVGKCCGYLGHMYLRGEGVEVDYSKALEWLTIGKKLTEASMLSIDLGLINQYGFGMETANETKALEYFTDAAEKESALGFYYRAAARIENTSKDKDFDGQLWGNVISAAAANDVTLALKKTIELYEDGILNKISKEIMVQYYNMYVKKIEPVIWDFNWNFQCLVHDEIWKAMIGWAITSEMGYENSQASLASLLYPVLGDYAKKSIRDESIDVFTETRYIEAINYYELSAKHGNIDSLIFLGDLYYEGLLSKNKSVIVDKNIEKSIICYHQATEKGAHQGSFNMGYAYEMGIGVAKDFHLAKRYYDSALARTSKSYIPVKFSLLRLKFKTWWYKLIGRTIDFDINGLTSESKRTWTERFNIFNRFV